jgi:hypothetical protein
MEFHIDPTVLLIAISGAMALFFDYFPGIAKKYDALSVENKRLIAVGTAMALGALAFVGQCYGWFLTNLACTPVSAVNLTYNIVIAVAVSYGFHKATKPNV